MNKVKAAARLLRAAEAEEHRAQWHLLKARREFQRVQAVIDYALRNESK